MTVWFCPACWHEVPPDAGACPACGYDLADYAALSYDERLLLSLRHPVRECRMVALAVLGRRRYAPAVPVLREILACEPDYFFIREAVDALDRIGTPESIALLRTLRTHRSPLVRALIEEKEEGQ